MTTTTKGRPTITRRSARAEAEANTRVGFDLLLERTRLFLRERRYRHAVRLARRILRADPTCAAAHLALGAALDGMGDLSEARRAYRHAEFLLSCVPPEQLVPGVGGQQAGTMAEAVRRRNEEMDRRLRV